MTCYIIFGEILTTIKDATVNAFAFLNMFCLAVEKHVALANLDGRLKMDALSTALIQCQTAFDEYQSQPLPLS